VLDGEATGSLVREHPARHNNATIAAHAAVPRATVGCGRIVIPTELNRDILDSGE